MSDWPQGSLGRQPRKEHDHPRDGPSVYKKDMVTGHKQHKPLSPLAAHGLFLLAPWLAHYERCCDGPERELSRLQRQKESAIETVAHRVDPDEEKEF